MIDLNDLEIQEANSAFVGIKKENKQYKFYVPKGCKVDKEDLKKFYFDLFRLQQKISQNLKKRDGTEEGKGVALSFSEKKPVFYNNLNTFFSAFSKTEILGINTKIVKNKDIDYSQIDRYLDEALYTKEGIPVILENYSPKNVVSFGPSDIIKMYCFVYENIKKMANEEVDTIIKEFSKEFENKYLPFSNTSIFENKLVVDKCKNLLEKFKKNSLMLKDFKAYYDALYNFFYLEPGDEEGIVAGIDNFWSIWEELCFDYFFKKYENNILYADYEKKGKCQIGNRNNYYIKGQESNKQQCERQYPFYIELIRRDKKPSKTFIYPDLVVENLCIFNGNAKYYYEVCLNNQPFCSIISNECFSDDELETENFLKKTNNKNRTYYQIQIKENIYNLLEDLFDNNLINNKKGNTFKKVDVFDSSDNGYYCISTQKSESKKHNRKDYENEQDRNDDFNYLKNNLKIKRIDKSIIDFKYKTKEELTKEDKIKQKFYELALKKENVKSIFILPSYDKDENKLITKTEYDESFCYVYFNMKFLLKEYLND